MPDNALPLSTPVTALVVGYGSIGARHARILSEEGCSVAVVSSRPAVHPRRFPSLADALAALPVRYVIIANETSSHAAALRELATLGFSGRVLVEKPLTSDAADLVGLDGRDVYVGYQLRFDPLLLSLRDLVARERVVSAEIRACSYLPDWRAGRDYRQTESAKASAGGGVLRDMSHEIDYALWLFGPWLRLTAVSGRLGALEIETDDTLVVIAEMARCPLVTISLNYLDREEERRAIVNTPTSTIHADILGRTLRKGTDIVYRGTKDDVAEAYRRENRAMMSGAIGDGCTFTEGAEVMRMLAAVERASRERAWVSA